jgi:hypothetical protein
VSTPTGTVPRGDGWFVLSARDARWQHAPGRSAVCEFKGEIPFAQLGVNLSVMNPGEAMARYHREADQEDFLVIAGEALVWVVPGNGYVALLVSCAAVCTATEFVARQGTVTWTSHDGKRIVHSLVPDGVTEVTLFDSEGFTDVGAREGERLRRAACQVLPVVVLHRTGRQSRARAVELDPTQHARDSRRPDHLSPPPHCRQRCYGSNGRAGDSLSSLCMRRREALRDHESGRAASDER